MPTHLSPRYKARRPFSNRKVHNFNQKSPHNEVFQVFQVPTLSIENIIEKTRENKDCDFKSILSSHPAISQNKNFEIKIESYHLADRGNSENVHQLPPENLKCREVVHIDIA